MKLDPTANIWTHDLRQLSGRDKGRVYAERATQIIAQALSDVSSHDQLFKSGRIRRGVLAQKVGCNRSAFLDNPAIVQLLASVETPSPRFSSSAGSGSAVADGVEPSMPASVQSILDRLASGCAIIGRPQRDRIITTGKKLRIEGNTYDVPTIVWRRGVDEDASDWLRRRVIEGAITSSSAKQYAKVMRAFLRYCHSKRRPWYTVDDHFLTAWRDNRRKNVDDLQVIADLNIVFQFYVWAEQKGLVSRHVGIYRNEELPPGFKRDDFPIKAIRRRAGKRGGREGWASPLSFRAAKSSVGRRNTPTDEQAIAVQEQLLKKQFGERDALIAAWAEEAGPRRAEILQIKLENIPSYQTLLDLLEREEKVEIQVAHRKRGSKAPLRANPYLVIQTRDWIVGGRSEIVDACRRKQVGYREPKDVFISSTTGLALTPDAVTKIMGSAFKLAGVKKASLHRLRAKAIVEEFERLVDGFFEMKIVVEPGSQWAETILTMVAETAGHASPLSLRPYLNFVLNRRLSMTEAERRRRLAEKTRHYERRVAKAVSRLQKSPEISAAIELALHGKQHAAEDQLIALIMRARTLEAMSDA